MSDKLTEYRSETEETAERFEEIESRLEELEREHSHITAGKTALPVLDGASAGRVGELLEINERETLELKIESENLENRAEEMGREISAEIGLITEDMFKMKAIGESETGKNAELLIPVYEKHIAEWNALLTELGQISKGKTPDMGEFKLLYQGRAGSHEFDILRSKMNRLIEIGTQFKWINSLNAGERQAVSSYTHSRDEHGKPYHKLINAYKRENAPVSKDVVKMSENLHNCLSREETAADITVYRGISDTALQKSLGGVSYASEDELSGHILYDKGFVSTSLDFYRAFSNENLLIIDLPKGSHGAFVESISGHEENELLLDCGQMFRIDKIVHDGFRRNIFVSAINAVKV
jgi:hypothetical protein